MMRIAYDPQSDALSLVLTDQKVEHSREAIPGVVVNLDKGGRLVSLECLGARAQMGREGLASIEIDLRGI